MADAVQLFSGWNAYYEHWSFFFAETFRSFGSSIETWRNSMHWSIFSDNVTAL